MWVSCVRPQPRIGQGSAAHTAVSTTTGRALSSEPWDSPALTGCRTLDQCLLFAAPGSLSTTTPATAHRRFMPLAVLMTHSTTRALFASKVPFGKNDLADVEGEVEVIRP